MLQHILPYTRLFLFLEFAFLFSGCFKQDDPVRDIIFSGTTTEDVAYITILQDTIQIVEGSFFDTLHVENSRYEYVQLNTWKWPRLLYLDKTKQSLKIDFSEPQIHVSEDELNTFLLNTDSLLHNYSLRWDMEEDVFRKTIDEELTTNFAIIDRTFTDGNLDERMLDELKTIERLKVAHRTANFISFQERKGKNIDRDIYGFISDVNLNNERLEKQVNNRNFQYFYLLDKMDERLPDSIYPFAVVDTVNKYSTITSIRKLILFSVVKSSFYDESVDHEQLFSVYEQNFGQLNQDDELFELYEKTQNLQTGHLAPSIGTLENKDGELITIEDLKGQNLLITIWGTWCPYCKEELPALKRLIDSYGKQFTNVGISFDTEKDAWREYIETNDWKGIHLIDSERKSTFKSNYLVTSTNVHFLIDKKGRFLSTKGYKPSDKALEELIKTLE